MPRAAELLHVQSEPAPQDPSQQAVPVAGKLRKYIDSKQIAFKKKEKKRKSVCLETT